MKPRKILIISNRIPWPLHDGGALGMDFMIRGYKKAGADVHLLAMNTTRHFVPEATTATLYKDLQGFDTVLVNNDLNKRKIITNLLFSNEPEHAGRFYSRAFEEKITEVIQTFRPDAIQFESPFLSAYLPAVRSCTKACIILRVNNVEYQIWERLADETAGLRGFYLKNLARRIRTYEERIWKMYDLLLPVTAADAAVIRPHLTTQKMLLSPFGIDMSHPDPVQPAPFLQTYHVGAMDWLPNAAAITWFLQEVWPGMRQAEPSAGFHFAGRYMPAHFHQHLPEGAFCAGEVPDVSGFIKDKGTLIVPLRAGGGIRVKILEAMAAGKLVISTDIGMQGIDAVPGIHYLSANQPDEFVTALKWVKNNPEKLPPMLAASRDLVQDQYSMQEIIGRILEHLS